MRCRFSIFIALCLLLSEFSAGRRRAEHALRASEERFRTLVQFSFDVYWETDAAASLHSPGVLRTADGRAGARIRDRQDPLGDPVRRARRRGLAQAPGHARRASAVPGFRARAPDCRTAASATSPFPASRCSTRSGASSATAASAATSPSASAPRRSTGRTSGSSSRWTASTAPCRERTTSSR